MNNPFDKVKTPLSWEIWEKNNDLEHPRYVFNQVEIELKERVMSERDADIISMRSEGFGLHNIGRFFGISKARVSQIVNAWKDTEVVDV